MWLPTNDDNKTIQYDTKFLKSSPGRYPALKWTITKIEDTAVDGISQFTMAQTQFDPAKDNVDLMIADYWESAVEPELPEFEEIPTVSDLEIIYSGKPTVKAGGVYKKLSLQTRDNGELFELNEDKIDKVKWQIKWDIDSDENVDLGDMIDKLEYMDGDGKFIKINENPCTIAIYPLKVKCNDYYLIGKTFTVTAISGDSSASIIMEVTSL
jgi:hypothetical protein